MRMVIDIDEDTYRYMQSRCKYQNKGDEGLSKFVEAGVAIKNGTPLPKGHGRLIDADELKKHKYHDSDRFENAVSIAHIDWADTIIEADGGDAE